MPRRRPTEADHRAAARLIRDTRDLERRGVRAASRIGQATRLAVLRAWRAGDDPVSALEHSIDAMRPLLTRGLVASHLEGRKRELINIAPHMRGRQPIQLANTVYDRAIEFLRSRLDLSYEELARIELLYVPEADRQTIKLVDAVRRGVLETMERLTSEGASVRKGVVELGKTMEAAGVTPQQSHTLESIFRTETQTAYSAGRWNALREPQTWDMLWGFRYVTAADLRVRPTHAAMEGITLPKDDPFWARAMPPNGWNCRCQAIEVFDERQLVRPEPITIEGVTIHPEPDTGFAFNPGQQFREAA